MYINVDLQFIKARQSVTMSVTMTPMSEQDSSYASVKVSNNTKADLLTSIMEKTGILCKIGTNIGQAHLMPYAMAIPFSREEEMLAEAVSIGDLTPEKADCHNKRLSDPHVFPTHQNA